MRKLISCILLLSCFAFADHQKAVDKLQKAVRDVETHNAKGADKNFQEAIREDPDYLVAHQQYGDFLMLVRRFGAAADQYDAAIKIDDTKHYLQQSERRALINQYGVATAEGGNLNKAKTIFQDALKQDDYPLYRYNLACVYAENHDLDTALVELKKAWNDRNKLGDGERFPDPRKDSSFKPYLNDPKFQEATQMMVF